MNASETIEILEIGIDMYNDSSADAMQMGINALKELNSIPLSADDIIEGEPVYIAEENRYYVVDHVNEDAIFFVGRNRGILRDNFSKEYHIYSRKPA